MLQKCYNKKNNTLTLTRAIIYDVEDKEFKNLPKSRINKYTDLNNDFIFRSYWSYSYRRPNLREFVQKIDDYTFDSNYNFELDVGIFPSSVVYLTFGKEFNQKISVNTLPVNLMKITFGHNYNQEIKDKVLPQTLCYITFGDEYNQQIRPRVLPCGLKTLTFGKDYNQIILEKSLPDNLQELIFGHDYNQCVIKNTMPKNLVKLTFGHSFNSGICCQLPNYISELKFGYEYNRIIERDVLPRILKNLYFHGSKNNSNTINTLPETIEEIVLYNLEACITNLPLFLKKIKIMLNVYENWDLVKKIKVPFGCIITDKTNVEINVCN
jgi:hypothetical protein